ncbi:polyprenyl diphosphate synthase [Pelagibacterium lacus]|uniref:Isoprenyl transferase n=1 Tax=Pelagibacterium lacus TaxID=2282655 RepID=A0A369VZ35_9HYPH|nr:polyprenyl diphosphate synthase [Pelagibacterium lacus]RDE07664.1 di-trans,poly-cis-decaprenylcistransferase [Pelagibacterium lacus]
MWNRLAPARPAGEPPSGRFFHLAIIMDGNGRWAQLRGRPRPVGHRRGAEQVRKILRALPEMGVSHFTIYAFSTENWKRSNQEVLALMSLFERYIRREAQELHDSGVRVRFIGDRERLSERLQRMMGSLESLTEANSGLVFNIAINYGGRDEIVRAARAIAASLQDSGLAPEAITEELISNNLDLAGQPEPDLVIRTGGHLRVSNFLLWHSAYAEYVFTETLWPDFEVEELRNTLETAMQRKRNFGAA